MGKMTSRQKTIEKNKIQEYLECAPSKVDIMSMVKWLEIRANGLFKISKIPKKLGIWEEMKRKG